MTDSRDVERRVSQWMEGEEAGTHYPDRLLRDAFEQTHEQRQVRSLPSRTFLVHHSVTFMAGVGAAAVVLVAVGSLGLGILRDQRGVGTSPSPIVQSPTASPSVAPSAPPQIAALLDGLIEARIAGTGAGQYLNNPGDVPLLYAASSGTPYERGEFEQVRGIEWPYGYEAYKVRLFAGDTVVEQLFFWPNGEVAGLVYEPNGYGTDIAPTTEDGKPLALEFQVFNGALTLHVAHPWIMSDRAFIPFGRLIPAGQGIPPTTDGGERNDWDQIFFMADPKWVGTSCQPADPGDAEAHAQALAASIRADPNLVATTPVPVTAGTYEGLMLDVKVPAGADLCWNVNDAGDTSDDPGVLYPLVDMNAGYDVGDGHARGHASGEWMRLYLFDVPATSGMQWLAIAVVAPESTFQRAVDAAQPIVDSIQVNTP